MASTAEPKVAEEPSLGTVKALLILDGDGKRLIAKYYGGSVGTLKEQNVFEKNLFAKTNKANGEIILIDGLTCVYRSNVDIYFYVAGSSQENEIMLVQVLNCLYESVEKIVGKSFEQRTFMDNLDSVFIIVDEIVDDGIILEIDSDAVIQRAGVRTGQEQLPLGEQTVAQVLQSAKEQLRWSLLK